MKNRIAVLMMAALVLALAVPAWAGSGEKCTASTQECLDHMAAKKDKGWVGFSIDKNEAGTMVVKSVVKGSPAEKAGFKVGDQLVALNGANFTDYEAVKAAKGTWMPGSKVTYTVKRASAEKSMAVVLAPMPADVYAQMVGEHLIADHQVAANAPTADAKN